MAFLPKIMLCAIICFGLAGCGFKLRETSNLPPALHNLYLDSSDPYGKFTISLRETLRTAKINLVNNVADATTILKIENISFTHTDSNASLSQLTRVYTFTYSVTVSLNDAKGNVIIPSQSLFSSRNLTLNPNEVLGISTQTTNSEVGMQRDLISKIIYLLTAQQTKEKLALTKS